MCAGKRSPIECFRQCLAEIVPGMERLLGGRAFLNAGRAFPCQHARAAVCTLPAAGDVAVTVTRCEFLTMAFDVFLAAGQLSGTESSFGKVQAH